MKTKKKYVFLSALLVVLVLSAAIGSTMAYFTTYTAARGGHTLHLGSSTRMEESYSNGLKELTIYNEEGSVPVFVRAKVFQFQEDHQTTVNGSNWVNSLPAGWISDGQDDYWYYTEPVEGGAQAETLTVAISKVNNNDPESLEGFEDGDEFHVVVVYESTPVKYTEDGIAYADWTAVLDNGTSEGGND